TQARYSLPKVVGAFKRRYPKVHLTIKQGNPPQLAEMVIAREADMAIATEALDNYPKLLALPGYEWRHCVVVPVKHPLAKEQRLTLETLAQYPIVTYDPAFAGRSRIDEAFRDRKSTRLNSSHRTISYAVFCLKKKKKKVLCTT